MTRLTWLLSFIVLATGCGFGDNVARHGTTHHACGDGVVDPDEGCDDGNVTAGDGCSPTCAVETVTAQCGNGVRETGEACDDGNVKNGDGCSSACALEAICGNGVKEGSEACDDGNLASGDGCSPTCAIEPPAACGLLPQTGCVSPSTCDLTDAGDGSTACRPITYPGTSDDLCATSTACAAGFTCVEAGAGSTEASCMRFCNTNAQCGSNSRCAVSLSSVNDQPLGISVCSNACSLLHQTGCPGNLGCLGIHDPGGDYTDCLAMGTRTAYMGCTSSRDCAPGTTCVGGPPFAVCRTYCNLNNPTTCAPGHTCSGFNNPLVINGTTYGACN